MHRMAGAIGLVQPQRRHTGNGAKCHVSTAAHHEILVEERITADGQSDAVVDAERRSELHTLPRIGNELVEQAVSLVGSSKKMRLIVAQVRMASPVNFGNDFDLRYCVDLPANSLVGSSSDAISAFVSFAAKFVQCRIMTRDKSQYANGKAWHRGCHETR